MAHEEVPSLSDGDSFTVASTSTDLEDIPHAQKETSAAEIDLTVNHACMHLPTKHVTPCPDCMHMPRLGDCSCICGLPLPNTNMVPAGKPPVSASTAQPKAVEHRKSVGTKFQKHQRWYTEVSKRLTGVPRFIIKDALSVYKKALKDANRKGCTEQGALHERTASPPAPARTRSASISHAHVRTSNIFCPLRQVFSLLPLTMH